MPDITMCKSEKCKKRKQCYRAMAKPDQLQSYSDFECDCESHEYRNRISMAGLGSDIWRDGKIF